MTARTGGLEGVSVADTSISYIDGERGRLLVRGHEIEMLASTINFEEMCVLLWEGTLPATDGDRDPGRQIGEARVSAFHSMGRYHQALDAPSGIEALRAGLAQQFEELSFAQIVGTAAVLAAVWWRRRSGLAPAEPDPDTSLALDYLRMVTGDEPHPASVDALDSYLVTVAEHGLNASTFAARVVASTGADPISAVVAALGALKGPLHGGAPGPVLDMLDRIGSPRNAGDWLRKEIAAGRRIMGMGHRIYRTRDPRAALLEASVEQLADSGLGSHRLVLARQVEQEAKSMLAALHPDRGLDTNVEWYTAVLLDALSLPRSLFTATFAVARIAGWLAHIDEQRSTGRLIRPTSRYVGPLPANGTLN